MVGAPSCCCPVDFVLPASSYRGRDERVPLEVAGPQGVSVVLPRRTAWRLNVGTELESLRAPRCSPGHVGRGQKTPGQVGSSLASFLGFILEESVMGKRNPFM